MQQVPRRQLYLLVRKHCPVRGTFSRSNFSPHGGSNGHSGMWLVSSKPVRSTKLWRRSGIKRIYCWTKQTQIFNLVLFLFAVHLGKVAKFIEHQFSHPLNKDVRKTSTWARQDLTRKTETTLHIYKRSKLIKIFGPEMMEKLRVNKRYWSDSEIINYWKPLPPLGWRDKWRGPPGEAGNPMNLYAEARA